ncbi:MAG TPA: ribosomal protein S18-alanine N-acetyltransferase [Dehalococcoidia bacterium]|nr:ribosomal protein S18-alanine N-acetyltransferase [Dehalococcoidia bacterium]
MQTAAVRYLVRPMALGDIAQVMEVERESFPSMWPPTAFKREIQQNRLAHYLVALERRTPTAARPDDAPPSPEAAAPHGPFYRLLDELRHALGREEPLPPEDERPELIVGFIGVWLLPDEAHVVTVAVRESHRRQGIGELLLISAIELAQENREGLVTLECRVSNDVALKLYEKYGFQRAGLRPRYYSDNREDAYVLTLGGVTSSRFRGEFQRLKEEHRQRCGGYEVRL